MTNTETGVKQQIEQTRTKPVRPNAEAKRIEHKEIDGPKGPEPTRFGDWERKGRCVDF